MNFNYTQVLVGGEKLYKFDTILPYRFYNTRTQVPQYFTQYKNQSTS